MKTLDSPPFEREAYTPTPASYKILDTFKSNDKRKNGHRHYYVYSSNLPTLETLEALMQPHTENVHWIYLTQQASDLSLANPKAFKAFAYCVRQPFLSQGLSPQRSFKTVYTYKGSAFHCELSYLP